MSFHSDDFINFISIFAQTLPISGFRDFLREWEAVGLPARLSPGYGVQMGVSTTVSGGSIGAYSLIQSTGTASIGANIYSDGKVNDCKTAM